MSDPTTFATRPDVVEARLIVDRLAQRDVSAVSGRLDDSQRVPGADESLGKLAAQFPQQDPTAVRLVDYGTQTVTKVGGSSTELSNVTFESEYANAYVVSNVVLRRVDAGERRVVGLHARALPASIAVLNGFSLWDMGVVQYGVLLAMIAVAATTVAALVAWFLRRRITRRRWWWLLAILVGPFKLSVNWITGAVAIQALTVQLLSLSATRQGVSPWILSFSIPAGAIAFLINTRRERRRSEPPTSAAPPTDTPAA